MTPRGRASPRSIDNKRGSNMRSDKDNGRNSSSSSPHARRRVPAAAVSRARLRQLAQPRTGESALTRGAAAKTMTSAAVGAHDARASGKYCCCCCSACACRNVCLRAMASSMSCASSSHRRQPHDVNNNSCCRSTRVRDGGFYCPGIDRDRIVPSSRRGSGASLPSYAALRVARGDADACIARIAAEHAARDARTTAAAAAATTTTTAANATNDDDGDDTSSNVPSAFSHGSSHGAIEACGVAHMTMHACKPDTTRYLAQYGDALRRARRDAAAAHAHATCMPSLSPATTASSSRDFVHMTLPQLTHWLVRVQRAQRHYVPLPPSSVSSSSS